MAKTKNAPAKKATKSPAKAVAKKAAKPAQKSNSKGVAKPAPKKSAKPATKSGAKPTPKKAAKPAPKKAVKAPAKAAPKKAAAPAKKVANKSVKAPAKKVASKTPVKVAPKKAAVKTPVKAAAPKKAAAPAKQTNKPAAQKSQPMPQKVSAPAKNAAPANKPSTVPAAQAKAPNKQQSDADKILVKKPLFKKGGNKKNSRPVETYDGKRVVRSELPAKALITIQKTEEEIVMDHPNYEFPTLRYSDAELKEFKDIIDKKLAAAREELKNLKDSLESHTESQVGNKSWNMEEGSDTSEMEYLMNQIARLNKFIRDLEMALVRIENKTYGICRATGKLIDKNRLRIVPHATLSMEAKMSRKSDDVTNTTQAPAAHMGSEGEGFGVEE